MNEYDIDEQIFDTIHNILINIQVSFESHLCNNTMNNNKKF